MPEDRPLRFDRSLELFRRAAAVIPEGIYGHQNPAFVLPGAAPYFADRAEGARFRDADGNEFIDFECGYGPVILGHNHPEVEAAVCEQMKKGMCFNHPTEQMVTLAERLTGLFDFAGWAIFAKNGSDVTTYAVRVAREFTGRKKIIMAKGAYHGSHAWCTDYPGGVLPEEKTDILSFSFNRADELQMLADRHAGEIAAVILTPYHHPTYAPQEMPAEGFWNQVRKICDRQEMLLIIDDIRAGFRIDVRGSHRALGIAPDLVLIAKAMANGHPISAALGKNAFRDAAEAVFFAGTFWFSPVPMAAALKTLEILYTTSAISEINRLGSRLKTGLEELGKTHGFAVTLSGPPGLPYLTFDDDPDLYHMQAFCAEMIRRGIFLHPHHNWFICAAHTDADIDRTLEAADEVFPRVPDLLKRMGT